MTHRHFGLSGHLEGDPLLNQNGARVGLSDRSALPLSLVPRHDVDMEDERLPPPHVIKAYAHDYYVATGERLPSWFNDHPIPAADYRHDGDIEPPGSPAFLPPEARRLVNRVNRLLMLLLFVFVLAFATCAVAIALFDLAHRDQHPAAAPVSERLTMEARL